MIITIDIDKLRQYMLDDRYGAFLVGDFGGALAEAAEHYLTALTFGETPPEPQPLIYEIVR